MSLSTSDFFLANTLINYSILTLWFILIWVARDAITGLHAKLFDLESKDVRLLHFKAMAYYKVGIALFCLVPWLALEVIS